MTDTPALPTSSAPPLVDRDALHAWAAQVRAFETWLASEDGRRAMEPFEQIRKLEAGNAKQQKKIDKMRERRRCGCD